MRQLFSFLVASIRALGEKKRIRFMKVREISANGVLEGFTLGPETEVIRMIGNVVNEVTTFSLGETRTDQLQAFVARGAFVTANPALPAMILKKTFFILKRHDKGPWRIFRGLSSDFPGGVVAQFRNSVAVDFKKSKFDLESAIYIGSRSPNNWSHWLINVVLTLSAVKDLPSDYDTFPILLPSERSSDSHFTEILRIFLGDREVREIPANSYTRVEKLVVVEHPAYDTPFALEENTSPAIYLSHALRYRDEILARALEPGVSGTFPNRIFVARRHGLGRSYNQEEAIKCAEGFGFTPLYLEELTLLEKVRAVHQAEFLIGPDGSGFANVLFCSRGAQVLTWWPGALSSTDNFNANLAAVAGARYKVLTPISHPTTYRGETYILDTELLSTCLRGLTASNPSKVQ